jgi:UDP-N-acetylmuramoyl-L-alanyl-D-glutamate--2,6-diaminopimelate ligase
MSAGQALGALLGLPSDHRFAELAVSGLASDSRRAKPGDVFFAIRGTAADGTAFASAAVSAGAAAVVSEVPLPELSVPVIVTGSVRSALSQAASRFWPRQPATVAAITGTNGKSSTVDFLRQIWAFAGRPAASVGTLGAIGPKGAMDLGFTTPDPIALHATLQALADDGVTHIAMEASSHALDQYRMHGVRLSASGFSNLTQDHLDYHVTMDGYRAAKLRLFGELTPKGAPAIVNADAAEAPAFEAAARDHGLDLRLVGWRGDWLKIQELWPRPASQRLDLRHDGKVHPVELPLIGEFQALNAVMAAGFALSLGEEPQTVFAAMAQLRPVKGRMEHVGATQGGAHVFIDYAHTPDGLDVLLRAARPHAPGKVVLVFGCGGDRDRSKRPLMGAIASRFADVVIVTDDNPRTEDAASIRAQVLEGVPSAREIGDRGEAISAAIRGLGPGDALLIAGKGHETGQIVGKEILPFSDQEHARAVLSALGGRSV